MAKKRPQVNDTVTLAKAIPTKIVAVYDGVTMQGDTPIYSVKTTSGDIYDVIQGDNAWKAIR
jgi:hypothetical protein